jgi:hypothetical protein
MPKAPIALIPDEEQVSDIGVGRMPQYQTASTIKTRQQAVTA